MDYDEYLEQLRNAPIVNLNDEIISIPKKEYEELLKAKGKAEIFENLLEKIDYFNFKE